MKIVSNSQLQTKNLGRKIAGQLTGGETLFLYGELGAGKTTFVTGLVNFFLPGKRVLSPTFIIVRHYQADHFSIKHIYHVDLYRISAEKELTPIGLEEFINKPNTLVAIEWAEKLAHLLPKKRTDIKFTIISENKRQIEIVNYE